MYIPKQFRVDDQKKLDDFIKSNSFGMLVSINNSEPVATHLPFLYDEQSNRLVGHMAKVNNQWNGLDQNRVLVIFPGPHAYISPSWYEEPNTVPTWNYVSVHVYGEINMIENQEEIEDILAQTVDYYEADRSEPWTSPMNSSFNQSLINHIVAFEIKITRMEGAWKLNQHHPIERRQKVIDQLNQQENQDAKEIARLMSHTIRNPNE
ncbi:FMN-binding negative transcriptional regulator [Paenibacillus eucommiae]|uniref:Transcriptional regulator n=1 Tax=Paenibacillus eucommiae TaxID=1355755 RepID=A0ABS4IVI6_9BACL|nr:FMN-binding negative transcriptional regulator [Paenibacillus eucommiae]MBP1990569.1 transcriptional regulator [Paenibacillus eucommiae]